MAGETIDRSGSTYLTTGFIGGSFVESRMGMPPSRLLNIGDPMDRQTVFYKGLVELGGESAYTNYWRPGGVMSALKSEFLVARENARTRAGVTIPEEIFEAYELKIEAYGSCLGLASGIQHCDGTMAVLAEQIMPQEHELSKGWDKEKSELMLHDPAIAFPLTWIRDHAEDGTLPFYWKKQKDGDPFAISNYIKKVAEEMALRSPEWQALKTSRHIPDDIETAVVKIAYSYFVAEDLPVYQERIKNREVVFTDPRAIVGGRSIADPDSSDCGFLPFSNVYYGTIKDPTGILRFKQIFPNNPEIIEEVKQFFTASDTMFAGRLMDKSPSELTVKDLKRFSKVWDLLVGGSQGNNLADFSKLDDAIAAICNMYNMPGKANTDRANVVGWMVGEAIYFKTRALMAGISDGETSAQLFRVLSLGQLDTPDELARVSAGVLGAQGAGLYGAMRIVNQFGLRIGTEHYNQAIAMLKTGMKNPTLARGVGQPGMIIAAGINRFLSGGKKK